MGAPSVAVFEDYKKYHNEIRVKSVSSSLLSYAGKDRCSLFIEKVISAACKETAGFSRLQEFEMGLLSNEDEMFSD